MIPPRGPSARRRAGALLASLACLLVSAGPAAALPLRSAASPSAAVDPALTSYYTQVLQWNRCEGDLSCAWLTVPLDYADPSGHTIRLRIARASATGPAAERQGSLVINPGGPGESGVGFTSYFADQLAPRVARQFDIVGFDPRGVGRSAPVTCLTAAQTTVWLAVAGSPGTAAQERRFMSLAAGIPQGCLRMSPEVARHVGTTDTIRDLDILRSALGDERLNWFGFSYGTYLGTLYSEMFPDRVGRMVLDGAVDPSLDAMGISEGQSRGFQTAIRRFAANCALLASCPFRGGASGVLSGINRILAGLNDSTMPTSSHRVLTQAEAITALIYPMYATTLWGPLRRALAQATRGDGTGLLDISDFANGRTGPNSYRSNMTSAFYAISCWDMPAPPGVTGLRAAAARWSRNAAVPELARALAWGNAPCSTWYGHSVRKPHPATTSTAAPILVVGTTYDPATPYPWAVALSRQLRTSTLLTYVGDGHTAYGGQSPCIDAAVDGYLLDGSMPASGTTCRKG